MAKKWMACILALMMLLPLCAQADSAWTCPNCGQADNTGNFCSNCGARKPTVGWDCTCGQKGILGNFCSNCGKKRGE